jgi:hypothetical protein
MQAGRQWLIPVILDTQEAEIRRIVVRNQSRQIVREILSRKTLHKNRAGAVAQGKGPEFKPQYCKKKKKKRCRVSARCPMRLSEPQNNFPSTHLFSDWEESRPPL